MRIKFVKAEPVANNAYLYWFEPENQFSYLAGQFALFSLPHRQADNRGIYREFTLSSSPTEKLIAIATRHVKAGSSFKRALKSLRAGDHINMDIPLGDVVLPVNKDRRLLFIAGGMGVTPFRSMTKYLTDTKDKRYISLIQVADTNSELMFKDLFKSYAMNYVPLVTNHEPSGEKLKSAVHEALKDKPDSLVYVSGPGSFIDRLLPVVHAEGIGYDSIISDLFIGY